MKIELVHKNPWFKVTKEQFTRHDGVKCTFYVVNKPSAVFIVPIDYDDSVYFIKQFRHATRTWGWELPAGSTDGEDPLAAAKRELQEETGLVANTMKPKGRIHLAPGISTNAGHIYVARDLVQTNNNL